ncbi:MAG: hypothetical protein II670_00355 [Alphaproteobacteria bacterium]|nr:hypothetical protein [Alphaproteobacteria bacterium]
MKRFLTFFSIILIAATVMAQNKGEKYIIGSANVSFGNVRTAYFNGSLTTDRDSYPLNTSMSCSTGFGYFPTSRFGLELNVQLSHSRYPEKKVSDSWIGTNITAVLFNPNIAYYCPVTDKFHFVFELGGFYGLGNYKYQRNLTNSEEFGYRSYGLYTNVLQFQYRISPKFAITTTLGEVYYRCEKVIVKDTKQYLSTKMLLFNLNYEVVSIKYYL